MYDCVQREISCLRLRSVLRVTKVTAKSLVEAHHTKYLILILAILILLYFNLILKDNNIYILYLCF